MQIKMFRSKFGGSPCTAFAHVQPEDKVRDAKQVSWRGGQITLAELL